jgi:hypothetical protein
MTTKADTSVKWFHSGMADAPVLSGQAGKLIELLDACLINGFSVRTPDSIVVADGVATVSISAGSPYEKHAVVVISGASNAALNGEWRIATSAASSFTFACPGVADGAVTGASVKRAGAGWGKPFSDINKAAYQSLDPTSTQLYLRVDDTAAQDALVRGYEQMTGIDAMTGPFPTVAQYALSSLIWRKSNAASAAARPWVIVADGSFMHVVLAFTNATFGANHMFGDIVTVLPSDRYHCLMVGHGNATPSSPGTGHVGVSNGTAWPRQLARAASQTGEPLSVAAFGSAPGNYWGGYTLATPPGVGGETHVGSFVYVQDGTQNASPVRGTLPGVRSALQSLPFSHLQCVDTPSGGAILAISATVGSNGPNTEARMLVDITGPWR